MSYVTIQDWMLELKLPMRETLLFALIYGFSMDGESKCYSTQDYLCRWMQCTPPTLHKALTGLIDRGLIIKEQPNSHGKCTYAATEWYKETLYQYKETLHQRYKETLHNNKDIDNKTDKDIYDGASDKKTDYEAEFNEVWAQYPKREGRKRALAAYTAARRKGVTADIIRDGVLRYAERVKTEQTPVQYIKQGGNWFAANRWEDQPVIPNKQKPRNRALAFISNEKYTESRMQELGISLGEEFYQDG